MNNINYPKVLKDNAKLIALFVAVMVFLGLLVTVFQPFKYQATLETLVIENNQSLDAYSAIRSAETINNSLAHIVYSTSFRDKVMQVSGGTLANVGDPVKAKKAWGKTVVTKTVPETGILQIEVYHTDPKEANNLAKGIAYVLATAGADYIGSKTLTIKTIDQPMVSAYPVKPNIALNLITSVALGLLLALGYVLVAYREESTVHSPQSTVLGYGSETVYGERNLDLGTRDSELGTRDSGLGTRNSGLGLSTEASAKVETGDSNLVQIPVVQETDNEVTVPVQLAAEPVRVKVEEEISAPVEDDAEAQAFYKMLFPENNG